MRPPFQKKSCRPSKIITTNLFGQLDCTFDNTDWRILARYLKQITAYCFLLLLQKATHLTRVFDNNGRCFCTQSSEETQFVLRNFTFTRSWKPNFDNNRTWADNFQTKLREIYQKFNHSTLKMILRTRENLSCHHQLKCLSSQLDKVNRSQLLISGLQSFSRNVECTSGNNTRSCLAGNF